jgi:hypothetical protein
MGQFIPSQVNVTIQLEMGFSGFPFIQSSFLSRDEADDWDTLLTQAQHLEHCLIG